MVIESNLKAFAMDSPLILSVAGLILVISAVRFLFLRPKNLNLPVVGGEHCENRNHRAALIEGTLKYPDTPYLINTEYPLVILPSSVINDIRNLPEEKASFLQDLRERFSSKHTDIGTEGPEAFQVVKFDLTRNIARTLDDIQEEIRYGFDKELGPCEDWTPLPVYHKMTRIVALLSGRVFVGRPLSRNEEWIQATTMSTVFGIAAKEAIHSYPRYIRDTVAPYLTPVKRLKAFKKRGAQLLKPILDAQMAKEGNEKLHRDDVVDEQGTCITWLLKHTPENERWDPMVLANNQMGLSMAAIHTTSMAITAAIYDLAAHPEVIQPLRDEIQQVIDEDGQDVDGEGFKTLKKSSTPKLWKLDSFLKESQRFTPPQLPSMVRVATSPIPLSTGQILPIGTRFGFSAWAIHNSPSNPIFLPTSTHTPLPPTVFDGFRFEKLRKIPGNENKYSYVTTSPDSLNFGHGVHACPGRFFASNEIKIVLIELLRKWEFRFLGGAKERPENTWGDMNCYPDTRALMEFRKRKSGTA